MYKIIFYKDKNGKSEVQEYLQVLAKTRNNNKDSKIKLNKITAYINLLSLRGLSLGEPYIKHLDNEVWELRPLRDRILFAYWDNNKFILLHQFMKQTEKTPAREIERAKRNLEDYRKRSDNNG